MKERDEDLDHLLDQYEGIRPDIERRIEDFRKVWKRKDPYEILKELFFCILTPQSKAQTCWSAVEDLECRDLILEGNYDDVLEVVGIVRFKYRKASYILEARKKFAPDGEIGIVNIIEGFDDVRALREHLVSEVKGYGFKEASHFLRNIGRGEELTILDRHILKNLVIAGVIGSIPSSMTRRNYLEVEKRMLSFSDEIGIPPSHLDLLLWYKEAGSIFK